MIYQVTAKFEGDVASKDDISVDYPPYIIRFNRGEEGVIEASTVQRPIPDYKLYLPEFTYGEEGGHTLVLPYTNPYLEDIVSLFQHIESLGGFLFKLRKIHWEYPQEEWLAETEEEQSELSVISFRELPRRYPSSVRWVVAQELLNLVRHRADYEWLMIPMSFVRQGNNDFSDFRYVNAFHPTFRTLSEKDLN